jgi:paraquat-inducible protein B
MNVPAPHVETNKLGSKLVWIVPIVAAIIGLSLLINNWRERGPRVTITFQSGEGLEVGKTLVKYRDVTIGRVSKIVLSDDRSTVTVTADLVKSAADLASEATQFWVVRPRIGVGWASGLSTLLSGSYIGVEAGSPGSPRTRFTGLEAPPPLSHSTQGRRIVLQAHDLGSLSVGAPVYFRRYQVGQIIDEQLEPHSGGAKVVIFVDAPNDRFITPATRFWNASGIDVSLGAEGMKVKSQSFASILAGGIAFDVGVFTQEVPPSTAGTEFLLYKDQETALAPPDGEPHLVKMRFEQPLRGLIVGAPVEFVGVDIGNVVAIDIGYDPKTQHFPVFVTAQLFPHRMGLAYTTLLQNGQADTDDDLSVLAGQLVARGLRVQPRSGSLLTGRLYLALDFVPNAPKVSFNPAARPVELPTVNSNLEELQAGVSQLVKKFNDLPLRRVVDHVDDDLTDLRGTLARLNGNVLPAATVTLSAMHDTLQNVDHLLADDSTFRGSIEQTLSDAQRTLRSVKALTDYLDRHPEALLRGRSAQPSLPQPHPGGPNSPP